MAISAAPSTLPPLQDNHHKRPRLSAPSTSTKAPRGRVGCKVGEKGRPTWHVHADLRPGTSPDQSSGVRDAGRPLLTQEGECLPEAYKPADPMDVG